MTNRLVDAGVPSLKASEIWRLLDAVDDPARLFGLDERSVADLISRTGIEPERLVRLLDTGIALAVRLDALYERGISAVTVLDGIYPTRLRDRLGAAAPPVLYCAGDVSILGVDGIGMVGSRDVSPEGVEATTNVAYCIANSGVPLISGGAKGVDKISMAAAYERGGRVVGVLADALETAIGQRDNRTAMLEGRSCLCTPYRPDARFTAGTAMGRNKIIYGLSRATLVIASAKGEGGTWSGATEALKKGYGRVAVWMGEGGGPGNAPLVKAGAVPIDRPEEILELGPVEPGSTASVSQMALTFDPLALTDPERSSSTNEASEPEVSAEPETADHPEALTVPDAQPCLPQGTVAPAATGFCWCGCGKATQDGEFFVTRHAPGAAQRAVVRHFGSVEAFLTMLGEVPRSE